jgi:hypothetical protein
MLRPALLLVTLAASASAADELPPRRAPWCDQVFIALMQEAASLTAQGKSREADSLLQAVAETFPEPYRNVALEARKRITCGTGAKHERIATSKRIAAMVQKRG